MIDGQEGFDDDDVDACLLSIESTSGILLLSLHGACITIHTSARWVLSMESTARSSFWRSIELKTAPQPSSGLAELPRFVVVKGEPR